MKQSARSVEIADQTGAADEATLRYALADGTSASPQARAWSQILARHACRMGVPREKGDVIRWLSSAHDAWQDRFQRSTKLWTQPDLPELGAAALCLIELAPTESGFRWTTLLQGDVCLFQIRDGQTIRRLPMEHSQDFGRSKPCFFSEPIALNHQPMQLTASGTVGDILVMASEPLARWIYAQLELGSDPWQELLTLPDDSAFAALVNRERAAGNMQDDDTALMFIRTDPIEDPSLLDAPVRAPVIPPLRPPRPPELDAPEAASDFEDIFELELLAEAPSPDEATELALPSPLDAPEPSASHPVDHADTLNEAMLSEDPLSEEFSDEIRPPIHVLPPPPVDQPDDITLDLPLDFDLEDHNLGDDLPDSNLEDSDLDLDGLEIDDLDLDQELGIAPRPVLKVAPDPEPAGPDLQLPLSTPLQPLEASPPEEAPPVEPAPEPLGVVPPPVVRQPVEDEDLFGDELDLFADNESIPRPRPTLLAEDLNTIREDSAALDQQRFRIPADAIPADVFDSVVCRPFSLSADEDVDILEALDDMPDSEDDDLEEAQEMSFFTPVPTVDQRRTSSPPPPPTSAPPPDRDYRPLVVLALVALILVLLIANLVSLSSRISSSPMIERLALRMDRMESGLTAIESQLVDVQSDITRGADRDASALSGLTTRISSLEARHEPAGAPPIPEGKATPQPVAAPAAAPAVAAAPSSPAAPAKKKPAVAAAPAKKKPAVTAATSPSQIPASAPSTAWIGCPRQVCSRSGSSVTIRSVTPVWASPYSGDRVAVLGAGTYPLLAEEDVGGYLWVQVKLK